jgi:outer membrane protein
MDAPLACPLRKGLVVIAAGAVATPLFAAGPTLDVIPNFVGFGIATTTEWMGAKDRVGAAAPAARVELGGHRFAELYGPFADVNLLDVPNWEFGPMVSYRFGRKSVEDPVVQLLPPIGSGFEVGAFGGYHYISTAGIPWRLRVGVSALTAAGGDATGSHVTPYASFWFPLSPTVFAGVGAGLTWSSGSFMQQRFGVSPEGAAASGLPAYSASAGVRQVYVWPAVVVQLDPHWVVAAGAFYQRLTGDAAGSPIVTQRGDRNQWTAGAGIGYTWK